MPVQLFVWLNSLTLIPINLTSDTFRAPLLVLFTGTPTEGLLVPTACDGQVAARWGDSKELPPHPTSVNASKIGINVVDIDRRYSVLNV